MAATLVSAKSVTFAFSNLEFWYENVLVKDWYETFVKNDFPHLALPLAIYEEDHLQLVPKKINFYEYFVFHMHHLKTQHTLLGLHFQLSYQQNPLFGLQFRHFYFRNIFQDSINKLRKRHHNSLTCINYT